MSPKLTTNKKIARQKIVAMAVALYKKDPDMGVVEIGRKVGKSHSWVSGVLKEYRKR